MNQRSLPYPAHAYGRTPNIRGRCEALISITYNQAYWRPAQRMARCEHFEALVALSESVTMQIYVWDLTTPQKPYSPGTRSRNLEDITSLAWNKQVPHILATASSSGYTVVWDLKGKREVVALNYVGNGSAAGAGGGPPGQQWMGGGQQKRGISSVAWHPDNVWLLFHVSIAVLTKLLYSRQGWQPHQKTT